MPKRRNEGAIYWKTLRKVEKEMVEWYLKQGGSIHRAAALLGVSQSFLSQRIRKLGCDPIERPDKPEQPGESSDEPTPTVEVPEKKKKKRTKTSAQRKPKRRDPQPNNVIQLKPPTNGNGVV